jgi:hypothetical protein
VMAIVRARVDAEQALAGMRNHACNAVARVTPANADRPACRQRA